MKKAIIIILILTSTLFAKAQFIQSVGIKGGMSSAIQSWQYTSSMYSSFVNTNYRTGLYGAVSLEFFKSKYFSLVTDIAYCEKGSKIDFNHIRRIDAPETDTSYSENSKLSYLSFSPKFKIRYETKHWIPYMVFGVNIDYKLAYSNDGGSYYYQWRGYDIKNDYKTTLWGIDLGAGVEYKINHLGILTDFQYQYDITKLYSADYITIKNRAFIFSLGLKYYFGKKS